MFHKMTAGRKSPRKTGKTLGWSLAAAAMLALALLGFCRSGAGAGSPITAAAPASYRQTERHAAPLAGRQRLLAESKTAQAQEEEKQFGETELTLALDQKALGAELIDMIEEALGMDIGWIESVGLYVSGGAEDQLAGGELIALLNGQEITGMTGLFDLEKGEFFLNIPALSDQSVRMTLEELNGEGMPQIDLEAYLAALPDEEALTTLLMRYVGIIAESLGEDLSVEEKGSEKLSAGELEADCTVIEIKLDGKAMLTLGKSLLTELRDDAEVKEIFLAMGAVDGTDKKELEEAYADFVAELDETLKELEGLKPEDIKQEILVDVYMNEEGQFCGLRYELLDDGEIRAQETLALLLDEDRYGLKLELGVRDEESGLITLLLNGGGKLDAAKKTLDGQFEAFVKVGDGEDAGELKVADVVLEAALTDDGLRYQIDITPTEELLELALSEAGELPAPVDKLIRGMSLRLRGELGDGKYELVTALCADKKECLTLSLKGGSIQPYALEKPAAALSMEEWQQSMTFSGLTDIINKLREAGVPAALLENMGLAA